MDVHLITDAGGIVYYANYLLYAEVGRAYHWTDRLSWTDQQVSAHIADPAVRQAGEDPEYGLFVLLDHSNTYQTMYWAW